MDVTSLSDDELDALRLAVWRERRARAEIRTLPAQIEALSERLAVARHDRLPPIEAATRGADRGVL